MPEPDCFLHAYRMRCNAEFYYVGKIPPIAIGRPSLQRRVVLQWFYSPRAVVITLSEVHVCSTECPSSFFSSFFVHFFHLSRLSWLHVSFYRATRMHSADYAVTKCPSVYLSVCHTPVLCLNGYTYPQKKFPPPDSATNSGFSVSNGVAILRRDSTPTGALNARGHETRT